MPRCSWRTDGVPPSANPDDDQHMQPEPLLRCLRVAQHGASLEGHIAIWIRAPSRHRCWFAHAAHGSNMMQLPHHQHVGHFACRCLHSLPAHQPLLLLLLPYCRAGESDAADDGRHGDGLLLGPVRPQATRTITNTKSNTQSCITKHCYRLASCIALQLVVAGMLSVEA